MKIKVFNKEFIPVPKEKEIFLKLEGDYDGRYVSLLLVDKDGRTVPSPYVISLQVDPLTKKITFTRTGGANTELVLTQGSYSTIREV